MTRYWCEHALLGSEVHDSVLVDVEGEFIVSVVADSHGSNAVRLSGLTIPGFANCHSHAFHRALRSHTQRERGTFWTWRDRMYALAGVLDPDSYHLLATAVYSEMAAAGYTSVGEFHYLHHGPGGARYDEPNAMGVALATAADEVGIRLTLLDTCYLAAGIGRPAEGVQARFDDGSALAWAARVDNLGRAAGCRVGAAVHSVRAVPRDQIPVIADWATQRDAALHMHLSEQPAENEVCQTVYGCSPTQVFHDAGALGSRTSAVHATHLTDGDIALLGESRTFSCFCPTTERDLADGIGPATQLEGAGSRLTLGSDSHAVIDPFEEMRGLELDERLASGERGHWSALELLATAARSGHESLGVPDAGQIAVGQRADLVTIDLTTMRTAGAGPTPEAAVFAASSADVTHVVCDGRVIASTESQAAAGRRLDEVIRRLWAGV